MFSFRHTSGVCKHKYTMLSDRMGQKQAPDTCSYFYQIFFTGLYFTR